MVGIIDEDTVVWPRPDYLAAGAHGDRVVLQPALPVSTSSLTATAIIKRLTHTMKADSKMNQAQSADCMLK